MPLGGRVLKQTQGNPSSHIKSKEVCESIDRASYETVHIAAGAVSRLCRVKSLPPMHMSSQAPSPRDTAASRPGTREPPNGSHGPGPGGTRVNRPAGTSPGPGAPATACLLPLFGPTAEGAWLADSATGCDPSAPASPCKTTRHAFQ